MRTLKQLTEKEGKIWAYLANEEIWKAFLRQAEEEGFRRGRGLSFDDIPFHWVMSLDRGMEICYVTLFNWTFSFAGEIEGTPLRIDYEKYKAGEEDYICREAHFKRVSWEEKPLGI